MSVTINVDRNAEIQVESRIKVKFDEEPAAAPIVVLKATCDGFTTTTTGATKMAYTLPGDKVVDLKISYVDANGNPAMIDGAVAWTSSDPTIADVAPVANPPADNSVVTLTPGSKVGNCQVSATADADLGTGVRNLVTLLDVTVVGGEAVAGTIEPVGAPQPKP